MKERPRRFALGRSRLLSSARFLVLLLGFHSAPPADAQSNAEQARRLVEQADADFKSSRFEVAARAYVEAHELVPDAWMFFSAAEAYELGGNAELAVRYYEQYRAEDPGGRKNPEMYRKSAARLQRLRPHSPRPIRPAEVLRSSATEIEPPPIPGRSLRNAGITIFSLGTVSLLTGTGLGITMLVMSEQIEKDAQAAGTWSSSIAQKLDRQIETGRMLERYSYITLGVGAGVAIVGISMWIAGSRKGRPGRRWNVSTDLGPQRAGFAWQGVF